MWMTEGVQQVQPSAGFQPCSENRLEWERSYFINIRVLNKNSSNEGFLVNLISGSVVSTSPGGGFLAQSTLGPAPASGLIASFPLISPRLPVVCS